jgi:uncharacterized protein
MKNKILMLVAAIFLVGALAACSPTNTTPSTTGSTTSNLRTLDVSGTGTVYLVPDLAYINIGVETKAANVTDALSSNTAQAQQIATALENQGIDPKDIQTSAFNIYPQQNYDANGQMTDVVYVVNNTVYVTIRDLTKLGTLLDSVVGSGANTINSITFDSTQVNTATAEARQAAIEDARAQAAAMASAAGVSLDAIQNISVGSTSSVALYDTRGATTSESSSVPISAGQLVIEVTANLTYTIK